MLKAGITRQTVLAVIVACSLLSAPATALDLDGTTSTVDDTTGTLDTVTGTTTETLNETDETLNDTTDTVDETVDSTTDTVETTTDSTTGTVDDTTDSATETLNDTTDTVDTTTDVVDGTVNDTTDTVDGTTDETTDAVDGTVDATTDAVESDPAATAELFEELTEAETTDLGMASYRSAVEPGVPTPDHGRTVDLLERANATEVAMVGGGPASDDSPLVDDDEAAMAPPADGDGASSGGVPTDAVGGAAVLGVAAIGAGFVHKGSLVPGTPGSAMAARTAGASAAAAGSDVLDRLLRVFYPLRYSRFDDSDPLEHEARAEMFDVVEAAPGAYLSEVSERADLPLSTARHHMRVLEREGVVASAKVRGRRRFYPGSASEEVELAAALNDESTACLLDALARLGPSSVSGLADEVGKDPSTVTHHLKRLEEDGVVVREREGRAIVNRLAPDAADALRPERETEAEPAAEAPITAD